MLERAYVECVFSLPNWIDNPYSTLTPASASIYHPAGYVGPATRQLMESYEIRILDFDIAPLHIKRGTLIVNGVPGM